MGHVTSGTSVHEVMGLLGDSLRLVVRRNSSTICITMLELLLYVRNVQSENLRFELENLSSICSQFSRFRTEQARRYSVPKSKREG